MYSVECTCGVGEVYSEGVERDGMEVFVPLYC